MFTEHMWKDALKEVRDFLLGRRGAGSWIGSVSVALHTGLMPADSLNLLHSVSRRTP